jgi:integrase
MAAMRRVATSRSTVVAHPVAARRQPPIRAGYEHFRLERQGALVSRKTLEYYDGMILPFLAWLDSQGVERFEHLDVTHARQYRARLASEPGRHGRVRQPDTLRSSHRAIGAFPRWALREGYPVDGRILDLATPRVPDKEPTVYHIAQVRLVLAACNPEVPTEDLIVRLLVGFGIRRAEVCGPAVNAPDGLPDLMVDSMQRGRVELRVRWDGGAKGRKSRRVPITPKLAAALKRYEARHRPDTTFPHLLINEHTTDGGASGRSRGSDEHSRRRRISSSRRCDELRPLIRIKFQVHRRLSTKSSAASPSRSSAGLSLAVCECRRRRLETRFDNDVDNG